MEFISYLTVFALTNLSVNFERGVMFSEDYFTLRDNLTEVRLYRFNDTINLRFFNLDGFSLYQLNSTDEVIEFRWPYLINNQIMTLQQGSQIDKHLISASTNHETEFEESQENLIYQCVTGAALILLLIIESPILLRRVATSLHSQPPTVEHV